MHDENPHTRPNGQKIAEEGKKNARVDVYQEELCAMIETKKALAAERKVENIARSNEFMFMED